MTSLISVVGIDWATKPNRRALARLQYDPSTGSIRVTDLRSPLPDDVIAQVVTDSAVEVIGVDVPFGWPMHCVEFLQRWSASKCSAELDPPTGKQFSFRMTDLVVHDALGKWPLSVSSDRIALAALNWAGFVLRHNLQPRIDCGFGPSGAGSPIIEVYPAATLAALGRTDDNLKLQGYKNDEVVRGTLLDTLFRAFHVSCSKEHREKIVSVGNISDNTDAFIAALTALIYKGVLGRSMKRPSLTEADAAQREGWIFFPA